MFCSGCGKELKEGSRFCTGCGKEVLIKAVAPATSEKTADIEDTANEVNKSDVADIAATVNTTDAKDVKQVPKKKKIGIVIGIIIAVLVLGVGIGCGAYFLFFSDGYSSEIEDDEDEDDDKNASKEKDKDTDDEDEAQLDKIGSLFKNKGEEAVAVEEAATEEVQDETVAEAEAVEEEISVAEYAQNANDAFVDYVESERWSLGDSYTIYAMKNNAGDAVGQPDYSQALNKNIAYYIGDLDADEIPELLMVKTDDTSKISIVIGEYENGAVKEVVSKDDGFVAFIPAYVEGTVDVFVKDQKIYVEEAQKASLFADGTYLTFGQYGYSNNSLRSLVYADYAGSDGIYNDTFMSKLDTAGVYGVDWNHIFALKTGVHDYIDDIDKICEIKSEYLVDYQDTDRWLNGNSRASLNVAKITVQDITMHDINVVESETDYIFADSNSRYLREDELYILDSFTSRIAINELYARHGYMFTSEDMQEYFGALEWYRNTPKDPNFDWSRSFNAYEIANKELLVEYAERKGWR